MLSGGLYHPSLLSKFVESLCAESEPAVLTMVRMYLPLGASTPGGPRHQGPGRHNDPHRACSTIEASTTLHYMVYTGLAVLLRLAPPCIIM